MNSTDTIQVEPSANNTNEGSLKAAHIVYILQGVGYLFAVSFLVAIVGVIVAYIKRDAAKGTWLESHFRWQITTFWGGVIGGIISFPFCFISIGFLFLLILYVWLLYRVIKGWLALSDKKVIG